MSTPQTCRPSSLPARTGSPGARSYDPLEGAEATAGLRSELALLVERQDLQLDGEVDLPHVHPVRDREHRGREVEDAGDAAGDERVADVLGGVRRRRDH